MRHRLYTVVLVLLTGTTFQGRKGIKHMKLPAVLSKTLPDSFHMFLCKCYCHENDRRKTLLVTLGVFEGNDWCVSS